MDLTTWSTAYVLLQWYLWGCHVFILFPSTSSKNHPTPESCSNSSPCCIINGTAISFDPTRYICCQGKLNARNDTSKLYCCGQELYSPATSICCNNKLNNIGSTNIKPRCCQSAAYDASESLCCNGLVRKKSFHNSACCGRKLFDAINQICCIGKIQNSTEGRSSCCGSKSYNPHKDTCCNEVLHLDTLTKTCCGREAYHPSLSTCCNGHLTHKQGLSCCNNRAYDEVTHLCCGGNVMSKRGKNASCCCRENNCTLYDKDKQICCGGKVVPKQIHLACCGTDIYDVTFQVCCGKILLGASTPSNWRCCGDQTYNEDHQICCNNEIHPRESRQTRCCGNKGYEPSRSQCEDFLYSRVVLLNLAYCGDRTYNTNNEICCRETLKIVPKTYGWLSQCCGEKVYDRQKHMCCEGVITSMPAGIPQCCGAVAINILQRKCDMVSGVITSRSNPDLHYYCGSKMVEYYGKTSGCCGDVIYGQGYMCCNGKVKRLPGNGLGNFKCCGKKPYNNSYMCCHGNLSSKNQATKCCGKTGYNSSTHACCHDKVYPAGYTCCKGVVHPTPGVRLGKGKCCESIGYNGRRQICCKGMIFPKTRKKVKCCGDRPYDPSRNHYKCCHASLSPGGQGRSVCCGRESVDLSLQTCCKGLVHAVKNASCCGKNIFDPTKEICCGRNVYPIAKYGNKCCRKLAFDETKQICQAGKVMTRMLCGHKVYNDITQLCCEGRIHTKLANQNCCSTRTYNTQQSICCGRKVYPKSKICCGGGAVSGNKFGCCKGILYDKRRLRCKGGGRIVFKGRLRRKLCEDDQNVVFLGKVTSVANSSLEILRVYKGKQLSLKSVIVVTSSQLQHRNVVLQLGKSYVLITGRLASKPAILKHVKLCQEWSMKLQQKIQGILKSCKRFAVIKRSAIIDS